jgi:hypothetical protein
MGLALRCGACGILMAILTPRAIFYIIAIGIILSHPVHLITGMTSDALHPPLGIVDIARHSFVLT